MGDPLAIGNQNSKSRFTVVPTHYLLVTTLQYFDDHTFAAAAVIEAGVPSEHLVAIEQFLHLARAEEHIA